MVDGSAIGLNVDQIDDALPIWRLSSGQQELLPLAICLMRAAVDIFFARGVNDRGLAYSCIMIEEPEAHLFPKEQKLLFDELVRLFSILYTEKDNKLSFFITTHSPYIL